MVERGLESNENSEQFVAPQTEGEVNSSLPVIDHASEKIAETPQHEPVNPGVAREKTDKTDNKSLSVEDIFNKSKTTTPEAMQEVINNQFNNAEHKDAA